LTAYVNKDPELAIEALEKMREVVGEQLRGFIPNSLATLADIYAECRGDFVKSEEVAREALRKSPNFANAHFVLGRALVGQGRIEEGIAAYEAAVADGAYNDRQFVVDEQVTLWKAQSELGRLFMARGEHATALAWFERGLVNMPKVQPLLNNRAKCLEALERYDDVVAVYREMWEEYRDDYSCVQYASFLLRRRRYAEAYEFLDVAAPLSGPQRAFTLFAEAAVMVDAAGNDEYAERFALRALDLERGSAAMRAILERVFARRGDAAALARLRADDSSNGECRTADDFLQRCVSALERNDAAGALRAALAGLSLMPDSVPLRLHAAKAHALLGNVDAAEAVLDPIPADSPQIMTAALLRAGVLEQAGRDEKALAVLRVARALDPRNVAAASLYARIADRGGDVEDAITALREVQFEKDPRAAIELATLMVRQGRFEEAKDVAERALALQER
jgi:tetratricopeptide (TPR) repeat protein